MDGAFTWFMLTMVVTWIVLVFATACTPYITRRNIAFGVSVPESTYSSAYFVDLRRKYAAIALVSGVICGGISTALFAFIAPEVGAFALIAAIFVYLGVVSATYLFFYKRVIAKKKAANWPIENVATAIIKEDTSAPQVISGAWYAIPAIIAVLTAIVTLIAYPTLPEQLPMHYNLAGEVDRYAAKSMWTAMALPIMQLLLTTLFVGIHYGIAWSKRQANFSNNMRFKRAMSIMLCVIGTATVALFGFIQLITFGWIDPKLALYMPVVFLVVILGVIAYTMFKFGQGGSRLSSGGKPSNKALSDDAKWKFGAFYVNRDDPALFVEKRFGMGFTLNFGNPKAWFAIIALIVFIVAVAVLPFVIK